MYQFESILQVHTVYVEDFKLPVACTMHLLPYFASQ